MFKALLQDGSEIVEDQCGWGDLAIHEIDKLALCDDLGQVHGLVEKPEAESFLEFVQFKTAHVRGIKNPQTTVVSQAVGWTDGTYEYLLVLNLKNHRVFMDTMTRMHYHPQSLDHPERS